MRNDECERRGGVAVATRFLVQPNVVCGNGITYLSVLQTYASFLPSEKYNAYIDFFAIFLAPLHC